MLNRELRVLIVEDNLVMQHYYRAAIATDPSLMIIDIVADGLDAVMRAVEMKPDIVLLDLFLPGMDGIGVIEEIMSRAPCPIIVISGELDRKDRDLSFEAQRSGAVEVLPKPAGMSDEKFQQFSRELCHSIHILSQVKVTTRRPRTVVARPAIHDAKTLDGLSWLVIGASTGGPAALYKVLDSLAKQPRPFPTLIAQHIASGFSETFCNWLGNTGCPIKIADNGETPQAGYVYIAADDHHLVLGNDGRLYQVHNPGARFTPSVDMLFESVSHYANGNICGLILTGMGDDGTQGLRQLYARNALCIAEDQSSCVIFGMPQAAIKAGVINRIMSLDEICQMLETSEFRS